LWITQEKKSLQVSERERKAVMTSLSCGVDALLRAAEFLEKQESTTGQLYRPVIAESPQISTGKRFFRDFLRTFRVLGGETRNEKPKNPLHLLSGRGKEIKNIKKTTLRRMTFVSVCMESRATLKSRCSSLHLSLAHFLKFSQK
jgi:hypothetical protein